MSSPHCTRELKQNTINSYIKSLGFKLKDIPTAIGIRIDETRRVNPKTLDKNIIYPLVDFWPTDKLTILDWWEAQEFDLGLEEWDGNCLGCHKKSTAKLFKQLDSRPNILDWHIRMESLYGHVAARSDSYRSVFFRGHTGANQLLQMWKDNADKNPSWRKLKLDMPDSGTCSESCEVYETE